MSPVHAEVAGNGRSIEVRFPYSFDVVRQVKAIPGSRWVPVEKGGPLWRIPLDLPSARALRAVFCDQLVLGNALAEWGRRALRHERMMKRISRSERWSLDLLPKVNPPLGYAIHIGPKGKHMTEAEREKAAYGPASFQTSDVAFLAHSANPINACQPGLGKTIETIAGVIESNLDGPVLVVAPATSLETVWQDELERWVEAPVFVVEEASPRKRRLELLEQFDAWQRDCGNGWLVVNPDMVRFRSEFETCSYHVLASAKEKRKCVKDGTGCVERYVTPYPVLHETDWDVVILDEFHKMGIDGKRMTGKALRALTAKKRFALSGTPLRGKAINLFAILQFLNPSVFTSKWRWAEQWLVIKENEYGKSIGSLKRCPAHWNASQEHEWQRPDCEQCRAIEHEFYESLAPYLLRRLKVDVVKDLPPKQYVDVWCTMSEAQAEQYQQFEADAMVTIDEQESVGTGVLAEFTRLKQFAVAKHSLKDGTLTPTTDSGKLASLLERLDERGILDGSTDEQAVVFSQFERVVSMVDEHLRSLGVPTLMITGKVKGKGRRADAQRQFQSGNARVMLMTTTAGGVAITLDRADSVHILDETWVPDDQEQAEDRVHRASRLHQVTVYTYRTKGTMEEYIRDTNITKATVNRMVLDYRTRRSVPTPA